jgi:hypothetical protein
MISFGASVTRQTKRSTESRCAGPVVELITLHVIYRSLRLGLAEKGRKLAAS